MIPGAGEEGRRDRVWDVANPANPLRLFLWAAFERDIGIHEDMAGVTTERQVGIWTLSCCERKKPASILAGKGVQQGLYVIVEVSHQRVGWCFGDPRDGGQ